MRGRFMVSFLLMAVCSGHSSAFGFGAYNRRAGRDFTRNRHGIFIRQIALRIGRAPSTVSREINRHGGRERYRASEADSEAWYQARRPKRCHLVVHGRLRKAVAHKDTTSVVSALSRQVRKLPIELRRSLTWDCGMELAHHKDFTVATNVKVYFCDPQSPWQRGTNENTNGLLVLLC